MDAIKNVAVFFFFVYLCVYVCMVHNRITPEKHTKGLFKYLDVSFFFFTLPHARSTEKCHTNKKKRAKIYVNSVLYAYTAVLLMIDSSIQQETPQPLLLLTSPSFSFLAVCYSPEKPS